MSESRPESLDEMLASLPRDVEPQRDLWPQIQAEIAKTPIETDAAPVVLPRTFRWYQVAAAVLLVVATSITTFFVTRQSMRDEAAQIAQGQVPAPAVKAQPASFSFGRETLGAGYVDARAGLDKAFRERVASLPPATRAKLERNLADLRHAADEISATLAEHPSDPLLQELLMSTYQSELQLLSDVNDMATPNSSRADL
jgi:hypothetical protein